MNETFRAAASQLSAKKPDPRLQGIKPGGTYDDYLANQGAALDANPKGMGKKSRSTMARDPWYSAAGQTALSRAFELSDREYTPYDRPRVAGLSQNEQIAGNLARSGSERTAPMRQRLQGGFSGEAVQQYMNPYTDAVLGSRLRGIDDEFGRQSSAIDRNAAATDSFRSGRSDLARARSNASRLRAKDDATNESKAAAFESGKDAFFRQGSQDASAIGAISSSTQGEIEGLAGTGASGRSIEQANLDFDYGQFLEARDWDVNNLNNLISAIQGVNSTAGTTQTDYKKKDKKSTWGTILGIAGTVVGAYFGGPMGAQIGGAAGGAIGGAIDG